MDDDNLNNFLKTSMSEKQKENLIVISNDYADSIFKKYNYEIPGLDDNDIVCFIHPDIKILDLYFEEKIEMIFNLRSDIGLVGIYGTTSFNDQCGWWLNDRKQYGRGHIMQHLPNKEPFHMEDRIGFFDDVVSIDGCCFFVRGNVLKNVKFDEQTFSGYHMYDCDYSFSVLESGYKIAVADILVEHKSEGPLPPEWFENRTIFHEKWSKKGYIFPINTSSFGGVITGVDKICNK